MDGDVDLFLFDDRGVQNPQNLERGYVHVWKNNGTGHFEFVPPAEAGIGSAQNTGQSFGDFNCDGHLEFFVTRFGSFLGAFVATAAGLGTNVPEIAEAAFIDLDLWYGQWQLRSRWCVKRSNWGEDVPSLRMGRCCNRFGG